MVEVEVGVHARGWLMRMLMWLLVVRLVVRHGGAPMRRRRRKGRRRLVFADCTRRCPWVVPVVERRRSAGRRVGARMRRWRGALLGARRGRGQDTGEGTRGRGRGKGSYGGEDATEDEAEAVDVGVVVLVVLHGGGVGGLGGVVRLEGVGSW